MHLIECPWCGPRAQVEFTYHCDSEGLPRDWESEHETELHERMLNRTNAIGFHVELWNHAGGCGSWLLIDRHNRTHDIRSVAYACNGRSGGK
ncbi:MAG: sarcosine oxidase subunit delta [Woeseia sp.]